MFIYHRTHYFLYRKHVCKLIEKNNFLPGMGAFVCESAIYRCYSNVLPVFRLRLNMTEKLFTGTFKHNQNKTKPVFRPFHRLLGWTGYFFLISFGRQFHTRADSKRKEFLPYLVGLTVGISAIFSYLKL